MDAAAQYAEDGIHIPLLDLRDHVSSSPVDGIHFEADGHRAIGVAVAGRLRELLGALTGQAAGRSNRYTRWVCGFSVPH